jgi:protein-disulfide isomerase
MKTATLLLTCFSLLAQTKPSAAPAAQKSALDKATLESYLRNVELWVPQVTVKVDDAKPSSEIPGFFDVWVHASYNSATKDELYYISKDGHTIIKGAVYDINRNPFQANIDKLKTDGAPGFGPAAAPVTLVVFSDFQCPFCKEEAQVLRGNIASAFPDKVRVYFKDFPLESIHPWARTAALAGRCVFQQNPAAFWDFFDWVYQNQEQIGLDNISGKLQQFAMDKNLDGVQLGRCIDTKATEAEVDRSIADGHLLQVSATPTIFLNGRKLEGGVQWQVLEQLINIELDRVKAAAAETPEKCCEVTLPKLVK